MATDFNQFDDVRDDDVKGIMNAWRESLTREAERPDWFWARQRALLSSKVQQPSRRMPVFAWAGVAATVALAVALVGSGQKPQTAEIAGNEHPHTVIDAPVTDQELMQQLDETMNSRVPEALQPANALAQEMEAAYSTHTKK